MSAKHFMTLSDGSLIDTRQPGVAAIRENFARTHGEITSVADLKATIRAGAFADGGYPLYFVTDDGEALSFDAACAEFAQLAYSIRHNLRDGWRVLAVGVNYEDAELTCCHTGERIPSAYGDDDAAEAE